MYGRALVAGTQRQSVLRTLLAFPRREFTISELAREARVAFGTAWSAVHDLGESGVVETRRLGPAVALRLKNHAYARRLLAGAQLESPQRHALKRVRSLLARTPGVKGAFLFGSVAEGRERPGSDIDLAVLGGDEERLRRLAGRVQDEFGVKVVPLHFSKRDALRRFLAGKRAVSLR